MTARSNHPCRPVGWKPVMLRSAALAYDGRESALALRGMTIAPLPKSPQLPLRPRVFARRRGLRPPFFMSRWHNPTTSRAGSPAEHITRWVHATALALSTRYDAFRSRPGESGVVLRSPACFEGTGFGPWTPEDDAGSLSIGSSSASHCPWAPDLKKVCVRGLHGDAEAPG